MSILSMTARPSAIFFTSSTPWPPPNYPSRLRHPLQPMTVPPVQGDLNVAPLAKFSDVAADCGFANYDIFDNATVRSVPLFVQFKDRLYPQMGLAVACAMLGANPAAARFDGSDIVIPTSGKAIVIPTFTYHSKTLGRDVPLIAAVPWFGSREWETMYDWPAHRDSACAHFHSGDLGYLLKAATHRL